MKPSNNYTVHRAVDDINTFRCCNILPDLDIVWLNNAEDKNLIGRVVTSPPRAAAYSHINYANVKAAAHCQTISN